MYSSSAGSPLDRHCLVLTDVWRQHHDELAGFMAAMASDGAGEAINLTGLTLQAEVDLALRIGQYRYLHLLIILVIEKLSSQG